MSRHNLRLSALILVAIAGLVMAAASPQAAQTALDQRATRTARPDLAATSTALKATAGAGATRLAATSTALKARATALRATLTPFATVPADEAAAAISTYAADVLGLTVTVRKAGGLSGTVTRTLMQTPKGGDAQSATAKLAVKSYGATLSNGAASLSYGSGVVSGDISVDVQASSLGVYSLVVTGATASNVEAALALAQTTFPALADLRYTTYAVSKGYAWYATSNVSAVDPKTRKAVTLAQAVILYVVPGRDGKASVSATVGRGEFAAALKAP